MDLVFDGQCGFCIRALRIVRATDIRQAVSFHDANDRAVLEARFPMLREADVAEAMYAVTSRGEVYRGFFAFRRVMWVSPLTWLLLPFFYFPGSGMIGTLIYAWVAKNRRRLGCGAGPCLLASSLNADGPDVPMKPAGTR
jgi:predicted DCC family thiol-disulfide oxidoreductase YuxK